MPIDTSQPGSPGWWLQRLGKVLMDRRPGLDLLESYYNGTPPLPEGAARARDSYQRFQRKARANYAKLVVEPVRRGLIPVGVRTGSQGDTASDSEAWRIWQANALDAEAPMLHRAKLTMGDAYAIVGPPVNDIPVITAEDPRQVITAHDPMRRRQVTAALKLFRDDWTGGDMAYIYLPGRVFKARRPQPAGAEQTFTTDGWEWDETTERLPFADVPVVRFPNQPRLSGRTFGEYEEHVDLLDRINHMILQRLVIATLQAFRQRAVKGVPTQDSNGEDIDYSGIFTADPGAMWLLPDEAELWESGQVDLTPILASVRDDVKELASVTQTPLYLLAPDSANQSAEGASLAREGLLSKVDEQQATTSESWESVLSLAFRWMGDQARANTLDMEILWKPAERISLSERADAASKATDLPWRTKLIDIWQYSPQAVDRMETERAADALLAAVQQPENA